jgi:hypothetical protein
VIPFTLGASTIGEFLVFDVYNIGTVADRVKVFYGVDDATATTPCTSVSIVAADLTVQCKTTTKPVVCILVFVRVDT